jgi:hypothetical protein
MPTDRLPDGREVDTASEDWRYYCGQVAPDVSEH